MSVSWITLLVTVVMEDDRTASSSRRSAKLRERSRGRESRECVYSVRSARECAVFAGEADVVETDAGGRGGPMEDMFHDLVAAVVVVDAAGTSRKRSKAKDEAEDMASA